MTKVAPSLVDTGRTGQGAWRWRSAAPAQFPIGASPRKETTTPLDDGHYPWH